MYDCNYQCNISISDRSTQPLVAVLDFLKLIFFDLEICKKIFGPSFFATRVLFDFFGKRKLKK